MNLNFIFFNKKRIFFDSNVKPTKNIVRQQFFSWIFLFVKKLYVVDFFCGSGIFGFEFFNYGAKKILNVDINLNSISNILLSMKKLNIFINDKYLLLRIDSFFWIKQLNILNFSLIVFDPPYSFEKIEFFFKELYRVIFIRKCLILFFETNFIYYLNYFSYDFFLIKKKYIGNVLFFLIKKI